MYLKSNKKNEKSFIWRIKNDHSVNTESIKELEKEKVKSLILSKLCTSFTE